MSDDQWKVHTCNADSVGRVKMVVSCFDNGLKQTFEYSAEMDATMTSIGSFWQAAKAAKNEWEVFKAKEAKMESKLSGLLPK